MVGRAVRQCAARGFVAAGLIACWAACGNLANPTAICVDNKDCPSGLCLAGVCATPAPDVARQGGDAAVTGDGASIDGLQAAPCTSDPECELAAIAASLNKVPCARWKCETGRCTPAQLSDGTTCTTAGGCPAPGQCKTGGCNATGLVCDDGNDCTLDTCLDTACFHANFLAGSSCQTGAGACVVGVCDDQGTCNKLLLPQHCRIDGTCYAAGDAKPGTPCARCLPESATSTWTSVVDGPCSDGDSCTSGDQCDPTSACVGKPVECPGTTACAVLSCDPKLGCVSTPQAATCTDGDPCTTGDVCTQGDCKGAATLDCQDGNPCTKDSCTAGFGCLHTPQAGPCTADAEPCTEDVCIGGKCEPTKIFDKCEIGGKCVPSGGKPDDQPCLICDVKTPNAWTLLSGSACNDGNACTSFDVCSAGKCGGTPVTCGDKSPCTADSCDIVKGCVFTPVAGVCNDDNACTAGDQCLAGKCAGTPLAPAVCDDKNPCTTDSCAPAFGCTHAPNTAPCNDGDACTKFDACATGACLPGTIICPCGGDEDCNDKNPCTLDACVSKGCNNQPVGTGACDDNNACTGPDKCAGVTCGGAALVCDDKNPCSLDSCVAEKGCVAQALQGQTCNDDNACTVTDICIDGVCTGAVKNCDDNNPCTLDLCAPQKGQCDHVPYGDGTACTSDNVACTIDVCVGIECKHDQVTSDACYIENTCLSGGAIHPADPCLGCLPKVSQKVWSPRTGLPCPDGNICTADDLCMQSGKCLGKPIDCADGNACTLDDCNPQNSKSPCFSVPVPGPCNDGSVCTTSDACVQGQCAGIPITCNDNNPCTVDGCAPVSGCTHSNATNGSTCPDDALACTESACSDGQCTAVVSAAWCVIDGVCRAANQSNPAAACQSCQPLASQTAWTPQSGNPCDDGNPCTIGETCKAGGCKASEGGTCDDANPCTTDACSPTAGCSHVALSGSACSDGSACTTSDICAAGKCTGQQVSCTTSSDQAAACQSSVCEPSLGCTAVTNCPALHACFAAKCLSSANGVTPGPVAVPFAGSLAGKPTQPSLRWHDTAADALGPVPRLWLAAQSKPCADAAGTGAPLVVAHLAPAGGGIKTQAIAGVNDKACAALPQLIAHPASFAHLALAWQEWTGTCPNASGRLAVIAPEGKTAGPATGCLPAAVGRPVVALGTLGGDPASPNSLSGHIGASDGSEVWLSSGAYPLDWAKPKSLKPSGAPQGSVATTAGRPALVAAPAGPYLLSPVTFIPSATSGLDPVPTLQLDKIGDQGAKGTAKVAAQDIDVVAQGLAYHAVEAIWDPESKRIGALLSGALQQAGQTKVFLAWLRLDPDGTATVAPSLWQTLDAPKPGATAIAAFRVAEIPASPDFLLAWAMPGATTIAVARVKPLDDKKLLTVWNQVVAKDWTSTTAAQVLVGSGGLSELVVAPKGDRFSLAYETASGLSVLTLAVSGP